MNFPYTVEILVFWLRSPFDAREDAQWKSTPRDNQLSLATQVTCAPREAADFTGWLKPRGIQSSPKRVCITYLVQLLLIDSSSACLCGPGGSWKEVSKIESLIQCSILQHHSVHEDAGWKRRKNERTSRHKLLCPSLPSHDGDTLGRWTKINKPLLSWRPPIRVFHHSNVTINPKPLSINHSHATSSNGRVYPS